MVEMLKQVLHKLDRRKERINNRKWVRNRENSPTGNSTESVPEGYCSRHLILKGEQWKEESDIPSWQCKIEAEKGGTERLIMEAGKTLENIKMIGTENDSQSS